MNMVYGPKPPRWDRNKEEESWELLLAKKQSRKASAHRTGNSRRTFPAPKPAHSNPMKDNEGQSNKGQSNKGQSNKGQPNKGQSNRQWRPSGNTTTNEQYASKQQSNRIWIEGPEQAHHIQKRSPIPLQLSKARLLNLQRCKIQWWPWRISDHVP